jgi:hypothetical protein
MRCDPSMNAGAISPRVVRIVALLFCLLGGPIVCAQGVPETSHGTVNIALANANGIVLLTGPTFCTTASERVYITIWSGKDALGGSQGAVGDRRAAKCGANAAGAGGL